MDKETIIKQVVLEQVALCGGALQESLDQGTELAATGLDSLGFATVLVELKQKLDFDPFSSQDQIVYPETFGELVSLYSGAASGD